MGDKRVLRSHSKSGGGSAIKIITFRKEIEEKSNHEHPTILTSSPQKKAMQSAVISTNHKLQNKAQDRRDKSEHQEQSDFSSSYSPDKESTSTIKRIKKNEREVLEFYNSLSNSSSEKKVLQNCLVLQNIFKYLPYGDLQVCRSVHFPIWSSEVEYAISRRPLLLIKMWRCGSVIELVKTFRGTKTESCLNTISELCSKLKTFEKGMEIWLSLRGSKVEDLEIVLKKFGTSITRLKFGPWSMDNISPTRFQNLVGALPNLTNLTMSHFHREWRSGDEGWNMEILLPQVHTLTFYRAYFRAEFDLQLLEDFFRLFPNLNNIHGFPLDCINNFKGGDKIDLAKIKSVDFPRSRWHENNLQQELSQLASIGPKINLQMAILGLKVDQGKNTREFGKSCCESLSSILRDNKNTIEYLIIEPVSLPHFLEYPEMKAVKKLRLYSQTDNFRCVLKSVKFFGESFDPAKAFPNLVEVTFDTNYLLGEFLKLLPANALTKNYFRGVTCLNLKVKYYEEFEALEKVRTLFPDLTTFFIDLHVRWLETALPQIIQLWPKLTSLTLKLDVTTQKKFPTPEEYFLDPVFTGIPPAKCAELSEHPEKMDIDLDGYRENLGIPTLTELKELTLIFYGQYRKAQKVIPFFSHVTPFYGFESLPDLKVTCAVPWDNKEYTRGANEKIQELITSIKNYGDFYPNYDQPTAYYEKPFMDL